MNRAFILGVIRNVIDVPDRPSIIVETSESWRDKSGQSRDRTEQHTVTAYGDARGSLMSAQRGQKVFVEGRLSQRSWQAAGGRKMEATEIIADRITVVD